MGQNDDDWMWEQIHAKNELLYEGIIQEGQLVDDYVQNIIHNRAIFNALTHKAYKTYDIDFWLDVAESSMMYLIDKGGAYLHPENLML